MFDDVRRDRRGRRAELLQDRGRYCHRYLTVTLDASGLQVTTREPTCTDIGLRELIGGAVPLDANADSTVKTFSVELPLVSLTCTR